VDWQTSLWQQFGAAWPESWYIAYQTVFFLHHNMSESAEGLAPPAPLDELDLAGIAALGGED
jgi:hypothetical protein